MALHNHRPLTLDRDATERPRGVSLAPVGQRLANFIRGTKAHEPELGGSQPTDELIVEEGWAEQEEVLPRFPFARNGYHCAAVDAHVAELEQELAEVDRELADLRAHTPPRDEVSDQIRRIGEQTSAVLIAANEQRDEILRTAREEADCCVSEARAKAALLTSEGEARLRELQSDHEAAERERNRLLDDVRNVSAALASLADSPGPRIQPRAQAEIEASDLRSPDS